MSTENYDELLARLAADVETLKKTKQANITAGGDSMILTHGIVDGEPLSLYRKDVVNTYRPDIHNIISEAGLVGYVEDRLKTVLQQCRKLINQNNDAIGKLVAEEKTRAMAAEAALKAEIGCLNIEGIKASIAQETERATAAENKNQSRIRDERERAEKAETNLTMDLDREISRASDAEGRLAHAIADETTRATNAEKAISDRQTGFDNRITEVANSVSVEKSRAEAAEKGLDAKYTALVDSLQQADTQTRTDLTAEVSRATAAETSLNTKIQAEIDRATAEEKRIASLVSGIDFTEQIQALKEHVLVTESALKGSIDAEISRATNAENDIRKDIVAEVERATREDEKNAKNISDESARAIQTEQALSQKLDDEIARSTSRDDVLDGKIQAEIKRATEVEGNIYAALAAEIDRATDKEDELAAGTKGFQDQLDAEIARSTSADERLQQAISDEVTRATAAETANATNITAETARAREMEDHLSKSIRDEIERSSGEDQKLGEDLRDEIRRAITAEGHLNEEIVHERTRAIAEEAKIRQEMADADNGKVDKTVAGDGMIVNEVTLTLDDSQTGDKNAKMVTFYKKMLSLANGKTESSQETYDLALLSGSHEVKADLLKEVERALSAEASLRSSIDQNKTELENKMIPKDLFKNNGYRVMSSQEIHNTADAYGSQLWTRTIVKDVRDLDHDIIQENHFRSNSLTATMTQLDQNDNLIDVEVNVVTEKQISDMLVRIFGTV